MLFRFSSPQRTALSNAATSIFSTHKSAFARFASVCVLALGCSAVLLTGCGMGEAAPDGNALATAGTMTGKIMGGQQPVSGAAIDLYSVGTTGYGSAGTHLATTLSSIGGNFQFTQQATQPGTVGAAYACPTSSTLVYLTVTGGDPTNTGNASNSSIKMLYALGACNTIASGTYVVSEISTVVSAAALQQYINPINETIGSPTTTATSAARAAAATGIKNAFNLVSAMFTGGNGAQVAASYTLTGAAGTVTATPEVAKINTIADILASCINTTTPTAGACAALYAAATPVPEAVQASTNFATSYTPQPIAGDTLQAALFMLQNPTDAGTQTTSCNGAQTSTNLQCLYSLASSTPPFVGLSAAPTDWTVGLTYGSNTIVAGTGIYLLNYPTYLAVNAAGDIFVVNDVSTSATATSNSLTELGPNGAPLAQALTGSTLIGPAGVAIDPSGNAWIPNYGSSAALQTSLVEYTGTGSNTVTTAAGPQRVAIDGKGDVFVLEPSYKGPGDLQEVASGTTTATTLATGLTTDFSNLAIDSNYTIWVTGGGTGAAGGTTGYPAVYQFLYTPPTGTATNYYATTPNATVTTGGIAQPEQAISIDNSNHVFVQNYTYVSTGTAAAPTLAEITGTTAVTAVSGSPFTVSPDLNKPEFQITDGSGNLWVTDAATTTASPAGSVFEISNAGVPLGPAVGFTHTYNEPYGIAIDPSGDVWVGAYNSAASASTQAFITEIIGAAVPVVTPLSAALPATPGGTSFLGTTPQ